MRKRLLYLLLLLVLGGCTGQSPMPAPSDSTLTISAAASLKDAFTEIGNLYQAKTGKPISFNFGASGALQKQIESAAPVDIFASAGAKQMDELAERGFMDTTSRRNFARNMIALIVPAD